MRKLRVNECGHTDRPYYAKGMCVSCYDKSYNSAYYAKPENKARMAAYGATYRAKPENKARKAVSGVEYRSRPENKVKRIAYSMKYWAKPEVKSRTYSKKWGINYEETLYYFLVPADDRRCFWCREKGGDLHLDHDHETLKIRGWAHSGCNLAEGFVRKSPNPARLLETLTSMKW